MIDGRLTRVSRRWLPRLLQVAAVLLMLSLGAIAVMVVAGPRFGYQYAIIKSGSMSPAYPTGSIILTKEVNPAEVKVGDVVSWRIGNDPRRIVTHRVVEVTSDANGLAFHTKGDANERPDVDLVPGSYLRGRVILGVPQIGYAAPFFQRQLFFVALVMVPGAILIAMELRKVYRELRGRDVARRIGNDTQSGVTHRVAEVASDANGLDFRTKGDANELPDAELMPGPDLRGEVILGVPQIGHAAPFFQRQRFFVALVMVPGAILIAMELGKVYGELRGQRGRDVAS